MKAISWSFEKAQQLKNEAGRRGVGFEECREAIRNRRILADFANPSERFSHQRMFILEIDGYAFAVPYIQTETEIFLKTVYPSRKFTAKYLGKRGDG